jgi:hypothetical protein
LASQWTQKPHLNCVIAAVEPCYAIIKLVCRRDAEQSEREKYAGDQGSDPLFHRAPPWDNEQIPNRDPLRIGRQPTRKPSANLQKVSQSAAAMLGRSSGKFAA